MPWCIHYSDNEGACAVLGGAEPSNGAAQRLCDQHLVEYTSTVFRMEPTCPACLKVWKLIEEFGDLGTPMEVEETEF